jgi:hypothetical protein
MNVHLGSQVSGFCIFLSLSVDSSELVGYGRATRPSAARTSLFWLINIPNKALRAAPFPS